MSVKADPRIVVALQFMGSTVLLLRAKECSNSIAAYEVIQVGGTFLDKGIARVGDIVNLVEMPPETMRQFKVK